jgi:hypothetical protein
MQETPHTPSTDEYDYYNCPLEEKRKMRDDRIASEKRKKRLHRKISRMRRISKRLNKDNQGPQWRW